MSAAELYAEFSDMIAERAWSFHRTYSHITVEELIAEGNLIFVEAVESFDENQSTFSTWLYILLNQRLAKYARKFRRTNVVSLDELLEGSHESDEAAYSFASEGDFLNSGLKDNQERNLIFHDLIHSLSQEGKDLVNIIFSAPSELYEVFQGSSQRAMKSQLIETLRKNNWSWPRIWRTFRELKTVMSSLG
jgi:RNA polymerase sigma factor (sigma-70 family)